MNLQRKNIGNTTSFKHFSQDRKLAFETEITNFMKKNIVFVAFFLCSQVILAQSYRTAAGLRLGSGRGIGLSVQQKVAKYSTIEGIFSPSFNNRGASLDLLYEQHHKILIKRFNIYMGAGLHKDWRPSGDEKSSQADAGFVGIIGGEITFRKINVSWDYKPALNLLGGDTHLSGQSAITLRVILVKQKKKKINWRFWEKKKSKKEQRQDKRKKKKKSKTAKKEKKKFNWRFWER